MATNHWRAMIAPLLSWLEALEERRAFHRFPQFNLTALHALCIKFSTIDALFIATLIGDLPTNPNGNIGSPAEFFIVGAKTPTSDTRIACHLRLNRRQGKRKRRTFRGFALKADGTAEQVGKHLYNIKAEADTTVDSRA